MNSISKVNIAKLGLTITGKTPSSNFPDDFGAEYMFVTPSDSFNQKMMNTTERYLSNEGAKKLSNKVLPPKSILITCIGSAMGKASMNKAFCITNQQINSIVPYEIYSPDYIYYAIKNNYPLLRNASSGSTALPILNKTDFDLLEIPVHNEKNTQLKIASVLSPLDSKIELNNRINAELEAMAKTLYDYWFVQFDFPDANSKPYKTNGGKMVWNEDLKREIPEGWDVNILGNYITIERGISYKGNDISDTGIPMVNLNSFHLDGRFKYDGIKFFSGSVNENKVLKAGDLMIATTDVTRNAYIIGKSFLLPDLYAGPVVASCDIAKVNISNKLDKYYLDMMFNSDNYHRYIKGFANGTLVLHLDTKGIDWYKCIIPPKGLLNKYAALKKEIDGKKTLTLKENQKLSSLRDWLLPMLMNGQVTVEGSVEKKTEYEIGEGMRMVAEAEK